MLLRGAVGDDLIEASRRSIGAKMNRVLFSGTHIESNGVAELIAAWRSIHLAWLGTPYHGLRSID